MTTSHPDSDLSSGLDLSWVDDSVKVGDDLFTHVNGKWLASHVIPEDRSVDGAFHYLRDRAEENVRDIITGCAESDPPSGSDAQKIGGLYSTLEGSLPRRFWLGGDRSAGGRIGSADHGRKPPSGLRPGLTRGARDCARSLDLAPRHRTRGHAAVHQTLHGRRPLDAHLEALQDPQTIKQPEPETLPLS